MTLTPRVPPKDRAVAHGFSLLEMIGVVAIIAVLAAMLLPAWIKRVDLATERAESGKLVTISNALTEQVLRSANLPSDSTWAQPVADWTMLPITNVTQNARRFSRAYYFPDDLAPAPGVAQTIDGFSNVQNARAMLVSVLGGSSLPKASQSLSANDFAALWDAAPADVPGTAVFSGWTGRAGDVLVQKVNYTPLFHRLVLLNRETNGSPAFMVNGLGPKYIARQTENSGWSAYYLDGSVISLCDTLAQPMTRYILRQDISFVFEKGLWRIDPVGSSDSGSTAEEFDLQARLFLQTYRSPKVFKASNQQGVITTMYSFMLTYTFWADQCPHFPTRGIEQENVPEYKILVDLGPKNGRLDTFSSGLLK